MNARDYYIRLQSAIHAAPHVIRSDVQFEEIDANECYVSGILTLMGGYELHVAEYVVTEPSLARLKYRYHLQTAEGQLVSRWDNAPHHHDVSTFPDHRHDENDRPHASAQMNIPDVLEAALQFILPSQSD